jgi:hypothetical protein
MSGNYKKKVRKRTIRRCLILFFTFLFFNVVISIGCLYLLFLNVITICPLIYMIVRLIQIHKYDITDGSIVDVNIKGFYDDPYTIAIISYKVGRKKHKIEWPLTHFGDYEEGLEDEIMKMLEDDKNKYIGCKVPVLYSKKNNDNILIYIEDYYKD